MVSQYMNNIYIQKLISPTLNTPTTAINFEEKKQQQQQLCQYLVKYSQGVNFLHILIN